MHPGILAEVAALGHTEYLCIADCGLPVPKGVKVIDVSVTAGIPAFMDVLSAVNQELVSECYILASEIDAANPAIKGEIISEMGDLRAEFVPHEAFKKLTEQAKCIIRTGEIKAYANVILVGGVNF